MPLPAYLILKLRRGIEGIEQEEKYKNTKKKGWLSYMVYTRCKGERVQLVEMSELIQGSYDTWDVGDVEDI